LLIVDDLHTLTGSPAEAAFERFIDYAPPALAVLAGSRTVPPFNLSRRRVSGALLEIGVDDLRLRSSLSSRTRTAGSPRRCSFSRGIGKGLGH